MPNLVKRVRPPNLRLPPTPQPVPMSKKVNVAVLGAAGGIGQPLSLLLKLNPMVGKLHLYDIVNTPGVAADLGHIDTGASVKAFVGKD